MEQFFSTITVKTSGEGFTNITNQINNWVFKNKINEGILIITTKHTSCSLIINENADPKVLKDLSNYMKALVPENNFKSLNGEGSAIQYLHTEEGLDDMPAHIKTSLTSSSLSLSIQNTKLLLGTWQAIYLWEHRESIHIREICIHAIGKRLHSRKEV